VGSEIVLGLGGCLDYEIVWDAGVLEDLVVRYDIRADEIDPSVGVYSERDLVRSVVGFVRDGHGGERFVGSSEVVEAFATRFARRTTIGGTAVRAAVAMSRLGVPSTVHLVSIDDQVRWLLPEEVSYVCSADEDTVDPHLIVQFPAGARVRLGDRVVRAPRANRLIYVNDPPNRELVISPELGRELVGARVLLVSGFNSMRDPQTVSRRLRDLREQMGSLPDSAVVVYEDGGFHVPELRAHVREGLVDVVDVHSMNEDEMQAYVGRAVDLLDPTDVATALGELRLVVQARTVVVHSGYWALAVGERAGDYREALDGGILLASTRYLHGDAFTASDHSRTAEIPRHAGGSALVRALERALPGRVCAVPALVLRTATPTTVGLGDTFVGGFVAALVGAGRDVADGAA
jgi:ADP-dependent phosphofructokinase/glucokinase